MLNRTFRLFISSTFDDFKEEREILNGDVFSTVDKHCQAKGYNFQLIDLRWGINSEAALTQNTLSICLEEVRRCKALSPKPNFLIMVGERYGWIPLPFKIAIHNFQAIITACQPNEASLLQEWYLLDNNEIGGIYYLKARTGASSDDGIWSNIEKRLHSILYTYALKCNLSHDFISELNTSATESEIIEGLLGDEERKSSTLAVFRLGHTKKDTDTTKIEALKQKILDQLNCSETQDNIVSLNYGDGYCSHFCEKLTSLLIRHIDAEIIRLEAQKDSENKDAVLTQILSDCGSGYFQREYQLNELESYICSDCRTPLFVTGFSGSGKSTLLADFLNRTSADAFFSFYGLTETSYSLVDSLNQIFKELKARYNISGTFEVRMANISEAVLKALRAIPSSQNAVIVIDGLDMFSDLQQIHENIFPAQLPPNVKIILSAADNNAISRFKQANARELHLSNIDPTLCYDTFTRLLMQHNRCIANPVQDRIIKDAISTGLTPMHIKLLSSYCLNWRSSETNYTLSSDAFAVALQNITSMFEAHGHNKDFVLYTLCLVAAAPFGIAEEEIQQLVLRFPAVEKYFAAEDRHNHKRDKLPFVVWSRLFYDLKDCLTLTRVNGFIVVKFRHLIFDTVLRTTYPHYLQEARRLLAQFYMEQSNYYTDTIIPNMRKAYNLLALLRKNDDVSSICNSLADLDFVDSVIKIGHVEEVINTCNYVLNREISPETRQVLTQLYGCVQRNRDTLLCYRGNFFSCAYECGLYRAKAPVLYSAANQTDAYHIFFPYSHKATVSWLLEENRYAVCQGSYVFIVHKNTGLEDCRIFLGLGHTQELLTASTAIWVDKSTIVVACQEGPLLIYNIANKVPSLMHSFSISGEAGSIRYLQEKQMLLFVNDQNLCAVNPISGISYYTIHLASHISGFDADPSSGELYICSAPLYIDTYALQDGRHKSRLKTAKRRHYIDDWGRKLQGGYGVLKLSNELWFVYAPALFDAPALFSIFDAATNKMTYLSLPQKYSKLFSSRILLGKKSLLIAFDDILFYVDFNQKCALKYSPATAISDISWVVVDSTVSVLSQKGLEIIDVEALLPFGDDTNFLSTRELANNPTTALHNIKKLASVSSIFLTSNPFAYSKIFQLEQYANSNVWTVNDDNAASIVLEASDGKIAIAYELNDTVAIFTAEGKQLRKIDKMHLAVNDNILGMGFSPDSQYLFVWRNHSLTIIDVTTGINALRLDLSYRPALDMRFEKGSQRFMLTLCNDQEYTFKRVNKKFIADSHIPKKVVPDVDLDAYFGPYNIYPIKNHPRSYTRINANAFDSVSYPREWFSLERAYIGESHWILFEHGQFYLNGNKNVLFANPYCHFVDALQIEQRNDTSEFHMYLREKNDQFSCIHKVDNDRFLLVSRMLNAVILFDLQRLEIVSAHKVCGNILGIRKFSKNTLELFTDTSANPIAVDVNLD